MKVLIIEDEVQTARDLQRSIKALRPAFHIVDIIDSVESGLEWFDKNQQPDLIFSDIQLGDGLAFDIFKRVDIQCPVVFCTAYDQYAIQAFRNNGIDYLLKPLEEGLLEKCLNKLQHLLKKPASQEERPLLTALLKELQGTHKSYKSTFLVTYRDKLIPVNVNDVLYFRVTGEVVDLCTKDNQQYRLVDSLDYIESLIDPSLFYRANRQYLVAFKAIREVETYIERKLLVHLIQPAADPIVVSKAKSSDFLAWMESH
ncbi:LytTR family DNA-binding domain-containing protein [Paraflavitalea sp. CAU 1676]|uniref:LytR/AlgR family response regulator transcription factor n=1 Tax=Paraflavitalea sp. CAU 1676 TaxID=3032598 RepID=UPI0023D9A1BA|nr:LytTR family DNA-binding domain-containing protein [Paraflavitalea sp. CAU 1676]MDF2189011.1 LytTR family DNA-binding domain-containing protein [Paraflavitalea sp. CAU 1676]